ncbi:MAG TPA: hypothetical protein VGE14_00025 [Marmoricola sp.]
MTHTIEMAPAWSGPPGDHGAVAEGAVGHPWLGRLRLFRYEIRCWRDGVIPDLAFAVGAPAHVELSDADARRIVAQVAHCPTPTWGLDELGTGDMWNSNSLVAFALVRGGVDISGLEPPPGGRAPGWAAGLAVAADPMRC